MKKGNSFLTLNFLGIFSLVSVLIAQGDFNLEDLNPNSSTYGQVIGPDDYLGNICIVFFGHEY